MNRRNFLTWTAFASVTTALNAHSWPVRSQGNVKIIRNTAAWTSNELFLQGINAPVFAEVDADHLGVTGTIPSDLVGGFYLRNGPNPWLQPATYQYPLEGDGMLHGVYFEADQVRYRNRWILTRSLQYKLDGGQPPSELLPNYANTNVIGYGDKILALYEVGLPYELTPELATIGPWDFQGGIEGAMTAHPRLDPVTGTLHFFRYSLLGPPYLVYYVADARGSILLERPIELPQPALIHDAMITPHYFIVCHCPLVFDLSLAFEGEAPFTWMPEHGTRIGLIPRHDKLKAPLWLETEPFWLWHFLNAYEVNDQIVMDVCPYGQVNLGNQLEDILANKSTLRRIVITPDAKRVEHQTLDERIVDFPVIDARRTGLPYQYGYLTHIDQRLTLQKQIPNYFPELIQVDLVNQTHKVHHFGPGRFCGEATFVPKAGGRSELEGYILTLVFDESRQTSDLVILDAAHFDGDAVAQVHLPVRVPFGFHGNWITPTS